MRHLPGLSRNTAAKLQSEAADFHTHSPPQESAVENTANTPRRPD